MRIQGAGGPVVELVDVVRRYAGGSGRPALAGVTVAFAAGTFTAVMGPSGSGKSTLLQCAAGLDRPTGAGSGSAGRDLGTLRSRSSPAAPRPDRLRVPVVQPDGLADRGAERAAAAAARRPPGGPGGPARCCAGRSAGRAKHRPGELSGGQQQRVAIARALVARPAVIFADEPTGALDTGTSREVLTLLREAVDGCATVVMVTHDPAAAAYADRVVFLADGRVVDELAGPTVETVAARMTAVTAA